MTEERYIFLEKGQKSIDELQYYNSERSKNNKLIGNTANQPTKFGTKKLG